MSNDELLRLLDRYWLKAVDAYYRIEDGEPPISCWNEAVEIVRWCDQADVRIDPGPLLELAQHVDAYRSKIVCCGAPRAPGECPRCGRALRDPLAVSTAELERAFQRAMNVKDRLVQWYSAKRSTLTADPMPRLLLADGQAILDGRAIAVTEKQYRLLELLLEAHGEYVAKSTHDFRSRDVEGLPGPLKELVESQPGAGTRIPQDRLYLPPERSGLTKPQNGF